MRGDGGFVEEKEQRKYVEVPEAVIERSLVTANIPHRGLVLCKREADGTFPLEYPRLSLDRQRP